MDKYIFLDFDGVIATQQSRYDLDKSKCDLVQHIVDATGAKIVVTSSWRHQTLEETKNYLRTISSRVPFVPSWIDDIVGVTIRAYCYISHSIHMGIPRGVEIKQWLDTHVHSDDGHQWDYKMPGEDFQYVILDDDCDMLLEHADHFVKTDTYLGMSECDANLAISILNNKV